MFSRLGNPRIELVSYANEPYFPSLRLLKSSALRFGVDTVRDVRPSDLADEFIRRYWHILSQPRGAGCWLWKPYLILRQLEAARPDDIIIYSDAGIEIISELTPLVEMCADKGGILLFGVGGHLNRTWTKRDCFVLLNCDEQKYWDAEQFLGGFQVYRKCDRAVQFVAQWWDACQDDRVLTDRPNTCDLPNLPGFRDHRHDQSIVSLLALKNGVTAHRDPSQFGNHLKLPAYRVPGEWTEQVYSEQPLLNSPYATLLNHHRRSRI
jgi:hypothetical protein